MPIINRVADLADEVAAWRRDFHENPELLFDVHRTAGIVAEKLKSFGCDEVVTGLGRTGVVGVIKGRSNNSGKVIGLRADMDALPIEEATNVPHKSKVPGKMHACGHDGHTAMLLGAAKYLAETRNFDGTAVVIFQPAEEGGGGGNEMLKDGLMERFGVNEVYGMHNMPGIPVGQFAIRPGAMMAAADRFTINIEGKGGHAARPHDCIDPVVVSAHVITALQTVASRSVDPLDSVVVSVCTVKAGDAFNVIPQTAMLLGTVRTLSPEVRDLAETRIRAIVENVCAAFGAKAEVDYDRGYPVTINDPDKTEFMANVARAVAGEDAIDTTILPLMG
ncbi:MAG: M20 aminoacylase family protein, partial [Microvirga sp.]